MKLNYFYNKYFAFIFTFLFLTLSIILITRHEIWNDEAAAWIIGIGSNSFKEFLSNMKDSVGHPFLWYSIIYFISHFITNNIESIKVLNLIFSTFSCFIFLKYAPFNKIIKILFIFSYFFFYEYSIISRNYMIGILPIIAFCALYKDRYKNIILIAVSIFFMGQAHLYTFIISLFFLLQIIIDTLFDKKRFIKETKRIHLIIAILIILSGLLLLYWEMGAQAIKYNAYLPTISTIFNRSIDLSQVANSSSNSVISSFLPMQNPDFYFWDVGSNLIISSLSKASPIYPIILSIFLIFFPIIFMRRRVILPYLFGSFSIILFAVLVYGKALRHFGYIFIFFIAYMWLSDMEMNREKNLFNFESNISKKIINIFLIIILSISVWGSAVAFYFDYKYPFSIGKQVTEYIRKNFNLDELTIVGYKDTDVTTILCFLDKEIHFPQMNAYGKYFPWSMRLNEVEDEEVFKQAINYVNQSKQILLVTHCKAISSIDVPDKYLFKKLDVKFEKSIVGYENFCLFLLKSEEIDYLSILNNDGYQKVELHNSKISQNGKEIIFDSDKEGLKLFSIPIDIEANANYLIEFDLTVNNSLTDTIHADLYGEDYDDPFQEFSIKTDEIKIGEKMKISKVLNSLAIPDKEIFFRIFTYSPIKAKIENLNIYKLVYKK